MNRFAVAFTVDYNYLDVLKVAIFSCRKVHGSNIDVIINYCDDEIRQCQWLQDVNAFFCRIDNFPKDIPCYNDHKTYNCITGCKMFTFSNPYNYEVILNCDADIVFRKSCLSLFNQAAGHDSILGRRTRHDYKNFPMLNGGHIFIPKSCTGHKIYNKLLENARKNGNTMDDWNIAEIFYNRMSFLNSNEVFYPETDPPENFYDAYIIHYVASRKPWNTPNRESSLWWQLYQEAIQTNFGRTN